jgi:hypothetical protein|tara:strand:+ start:429 stop:812 length:384 start_codon:yes stop_codon:yes gene_type:complete
MGKRGQPKISYFVKFIIAYKVIQYQKRYNLTPRASWLKLTEHKSFKDLIKEHYKNKDQTDWWVESILKDTDVKINFYKNHIRKIIEQFPKLKIYTQAEYKAHLVKIKTNKTKGIGSLKNTIKRVRRS